MPHDHPHHHHHGPRPVYHPLPESHLRREKRAKLIYQTPDGLQEFSLADVRRMRDLTLEPDNPG